VVHQTVNGFWCDEYLKTHNRDLKKLEDKDCYRAAEDDVDHTLYLMPVNPFSWQEAPRRHYGRKLNVSSQKRPGLEQTGLEQTISFSPFNVPKLRVPILNAKTKQFESSEMIHRDKIARVPNQAHNEPKKLGYFWEKDTSPQIRKKREKIRMTDSAPVRDGQRLIRKHRKQRSAQDSDSDGIR
jgi:hypothetical protein